MTPLLLDAKFLLLAYTGHGRVHPQEPAHMTLGDIAEDGLQYRGAVTHCADPECFITFDLAHVEAHPPHSLAHRWWMSLSKARAIAHALWFARD